jgi:hypothetical protein
MTSQFRKLRFTVVALSIGMQLPMMTALAQPASTKIQCETVSFTVHGFNPPKLTRPPGPFELIIRNSTRLPSLTFALEDSGARAAKTDSKVGVTGSRKDQSVVDLPIGTYTVRIRELPAFTMQIVISATGK